MSPNEYPIFLGVGVLFIFMGFIAVGWGRWEQKTYDDYLSKLEDVREYLTHWPERPQPQGLLAGGWISVALGAVLVIVGLVLMLSS